MSELAKGFAYLLGAILFLTLAFTGSPEPTPAKRGFQWEKIGDIEERYGTFLIECEEEEYIVVKTVDGVAVCPHHRTSINVEAE
jgi:hypothetical protein